MKRVNQMIMALVKVDKNHEMVVAGQTVEELAARIAGIKVVKLSICYMLDI